jgi:uncharacterized membrane protein YdjX (TVP38/TMEM64 family)
MNHRFASHRKDRECSSHSNKPTATNSASPSRRQSLGKQFSLSRSRLVWLIAIAFLAGLLLFWLTPLKNLFNYDFLASWLHQLNCFPCAATFFIILHAIATVFGVPGTVLTVAGGAVFGLFWGSLLSAIGATVGAVGAFWIARYLFHDWAERRFARHRRLAVFREAVKRSPLRFILAVRFAPISPFNVVNFLFGLTPISSIDYTIGTFFGIIPGIVAYTWIGVTGIDAFQQGEWLPFLIALSLLALLSCLPAFARQYWQGR